MPHVSPARQTLPKPAPLANRWGDLPFRPTRLRAANNEVALCRLFTSPRRRRRPCWGGRLPTLGGGVEGGALGGGRFKGCGTPEPMGGAVFPHPYPPPLHPSVGVQVRGGKCTPKSFGSYPHRRRLGVVGSKGIYDVGSGDRSAMGRGVGRCEPSPLLEQLIVFTVSCLGGIAGGRGGIRKGGRQGGRKPRPGGGVYSSPPSRQATFGFKPSIAISPIDPRSLQPPLDADPQARKGGWGTRLSYPP
jgi:hypothetical protein